MSESLKVVGTERRKSVFNYEMCRIFARKRKFQISRDDANHSFLYVYDIDHILLAHDNELLLSSVTLVHSRLRSFIFSLSIDTFHSPWNLVLV